ncbi:hypothetical protein NDU88_001607 [Pleurodeles waltl]|uniref:Uncharacterized protein n=1 Tax=Pleurodeles waltl TaxID=8319 RepID=A0AAV7LDA6_PLEWA|nr:hypothetical protein NDU88_001607 [Pleurodeles waltl]
MSASGSLDSSEEASVPAEFKGNWSKDLGFNIPHAVMTGMRTRNVGIMKFIDNSLRPTAWNSCLARLSLKACASARCHYEFGVGCVVLAVKHLHNSTVDFLTGKLT